MSDMKTLTINGVTYSIMDETARAEINEKFPSGILAASNGGTGVSALSTAPSSGSSAPVTSGGVYSALTGSFSASIKTGDNYQDPATELLRNSKLYTGDTDSTPTVEGVIHWKYE